MHRYNLGLGQCHRKVAHSEPMSEPISHVPQDTASHSGPELLPVVALVGSEEGEHHDSKRRLGKQVSTNFGSSGDQSSCQRRTPIILLENNEMTNQGTYYRAPFESDGNHCPLSPVSTRPQDPGRFCSTVQSLTRPSFDVDGYGPSNVTTLTVMSRDGFSGPAGCQLSPSSHSGRK